MDKLGMDLDDGSSDDDQENLQECLCQAFQAMLTMNQIQGTMPPVQQGVQRMPIHQPQVANAMNMQPPHPASQGQHIQVLQQLLQVLKSPNTPQQQQEVISILKAHPQLLAAFIKQRSQQRLQQQQLQQQQQQHHQNPALQMPGMQQQPQQQPQCCCVGLSQFQAHGSVSQAENSGQDTSILQ